MYLFFQTSNVLSQKNALIKIWSLAKYNFIPEDLEPLKYLSNYVTNLNNNSPTNLIVSVRYLKFTYYLISILKLHKLFLGICLKCFYGSIQKNNIKYTNKFSK